LIGTQASGLLMEQSQARRLRTKCLRHKNDIRFG